MHLIPAVEYLEIKLLSLYCIS